MLCTSDQLFLVYMVYMFFFLCCNTVNGYKDELVLLYQHCCSLSTMCEKMENNVYPVRTNRSGIRAFLIPSVDRPHDIFHDSNRLPLLRTQLRLSRQGVQLLNKQDELLTTKNNINMPMSKSVPRTTTTGNNNNNNNNSNNNNNNNNRTNDHGTTHNSANASMATGRPHSAAATLVRNRGERATTANTIVSSNAQMDIGEYHVPVMIPLLFPRDDVEDGLQLENTISGMSPEELVVQIKEMRTYIKTGLRRKVEEQVLNDLASHETVAYIKAVEDEREHYKKTVSAGAALCVGVWGQLFMCWAVVLGVGALFFLTFSSSSCCCCLSPPRRTVGT
jgi:hypothetical protein